MATTECWEQSYNPNIYQNMNFDSSSCDSVRNCRIELSPRFDSYQYRNNCVDHIEQLQPKNHVDSNEPIHISPAEKITSENANQNHAQHGSYQRALHKISKSSEYNPPPNKTSFRDAFNSYEVDSNRDHVYNSNSDFTSSAISTYQEDWIDNKTRYGGNVDTNPKQFSLENQISLKINVHEVHSSVPANSRETISNEQAINEDVGHRDALKGCKKYTTGYGFFFREHHHQLLAHNPYATFSDLSKDIASKWRKLNRNQKQVYRDKVNKKPFSTSYGKFFRDNFQQIKKSNPEATFGQISSMMSKKWDSMTWYQRKSYNVSKARISSDWKYAYNFNYASENQLNQSRESPGSSQDSENTVLNAFDFRAINDSKQNMCYSRTNRNEMIQGRREEIADESEKLLLVL